MPLGFFTPSPFINASFSALTKLSRNLSLSQVSILIVASSSKAWLAFGWAYNS